MEVAAAMSRIATLDLLRPDFGDRLGALIAACHDEGLPLRVFETIRSPERQTALHARGRDPAAIDYGRTVTDAKAYQSAHQYGLAADLVFWRNGWEWPPYESPEWQAMGDLALLNGLHTLTRERPHVQLATFSLRVMTPGPMDTAGWYEWLKTNNGG